MLFQLLLKANYLTIVSGTQQFYAPIFRKKLPTFMMYCPLLWCNVLTKPCWFSLFVIILKYSEETYAMCSAWRNFQTFMFHCLLCKNSAYLPFPPSVSLVHSAPSVKYYSRHLCPHISSELLSVLSLSYENIKFTSLTNKLKYTMYIFKCLFDKKPLYLTFTSNLTMASVIVMLTACGYQIL